MAAPVTFVEQRWETYTDEDHAVWAILYRRRMDALATTGSRTFLDGAARIGLQPDCVPNLVEVNRRLAARTGWAAVPVSGFLPAREFFACLAQRHFPTTVTIRPRQQLDYLPEPDIFHDVFGHVPLHAEPTFAEWLQRFGRAACAAETEAQVEGMTRLFWFTVEFGLVRESGVPKVYGSGLISSHQDASNALGPSCARRPFALDAVLAQPFQVDRLQEVLFILESFEQLFGVLREAEQRLGLQPR